MSPKSRDRAWRLAWHLAVIVIAAPVARADSTWVEHYRAARGAYTAGDFGGFRSQLRKVAAILGEQPGVNYNLACAAARLGDRAEALRRLELYAASGLVHDASVDSDFASLWNEPAFRKVAARIRANGDSIGTARVRHRFRDAALLTEDLAYDPGSRSFFVSSIHRGRVIEVTAGGVERELHDPGARPGWGVFAMCVDAPRHRLWASVGASPTTEGYVGGDPGRTGLVAWDLRTRRPVQRLDLPRDGVPHLLGDLTVGPDGTVYACDSRSGALHVVRPGADSIGTLVPDGGFDSPQTPALAPDGRRLFVADYSRGIGLVDLRTLARSWMPFAPGVALQGIDGLYAYGKDLIAVQNGTQPARVMRFRLDATGGRVLGGTPIESGTRRLGQPTHGVVVGAEFFFLANTGWERVGRDEVLRTGPTDTPPAILSASLAPRTARRH